jgi:hypothetical protein
LIWSSAADRNKGILKLSFFLPFRVIADVKTGSFSFPILLLGKLGGLINGFQDASLTLLLLRGLKSCFSQGLQNYEA